MKFFALIILVYSGLAHSAVDTTAAQTEQAVQQILQDELNLERQKLLIMTDDLTQMRRQRADLQRQAQVSAPAQIKFNQNQIQNLTEQLQSLRGSEASIDRSAEAYLNQLTASAKASLEKTNLNLENAEQNLRQIQERINFTATYPVSATMTGNPDLESLREQYNVQSVQISNLRQQRQKLAEMQVAQIQIVNNDRAFQKSQLYDNISALQDQIGTLRNDNAQLEADRVQAQISLTNLEQEIAQRQQAILKQSATVRTLDTSLQNKKSF